MQLINLTPHDVMIGTMKGEEFCLQKMIPSSGIARVTTKTTVCDPIDGIPVNAVQFIKAENVPPAKEGTRYIVSLPVQQFATERKDLISPYSEKAFRQGAKILGVPGFVRHESSTIEKVAEEKVTQEKPALLFKRLVNMSFAPVTVQIDDQKRVFPKSDRVVQIKTEATQGEPLDGIPFYSLKFLDIQNLPPEEEGVAYIVPMPVAQAAARSDFFAADTENAIRDKGDIVAVRGFVHYI